MRQVHGMKAVTPYPGRPAGNAKTRQALLYIEGSVEPAWSQPTP